MHTRYEFNYVGFNKKINIKEMMGVLVHRIFTMIFLDMDPLTCSN